MWVATQDLPRSATHPFCRRLNQILERANFAASVERLWPGIATIWLPSTGLGHRFAHRDVRRLHLSVSIVFTTGC